MKISDELVKHIAALARLKFEKDELAEFRTQFERIVAHVEKINELSLDEVKPTSHSIERSNAFREDEIKESLKKELALSNAPSAKGGFVAVPKVIEES